MCFCRRWERFSERIVEQTADETVLQKEEQLVAVPKTVFRRTVEQVPGSLFVKEAVDYFEQGQQRTVEHAPVPEIFKKTVDRFERVLRQPNERFVQRPVPQNFGRDRW